MTLIKAENRELDALDINQPKESPPEQSLARGYYLALTFGTLLSSQGADAQKLDPSGPHSWLDVQLYAGFQRPTTWGVWSGGPSGPRGAWRNIHDSGGPCTGGPSEAEEALDAQGEAGMPADLADGQEHAWHEGRAVVRVVPEGEGLPRCAHQHLLVRHQAGQAHGVHRHALDVGTAGPRQRVERGIGRRRQCGRPTGGRYEAGRADRRPRGGVDLVRVM